MKYWPLNPSTSANSRRGEEEECSRGGGTGGEGKHFGKVGQKKGGGQMEGGSHCYAMLHTTTTAHCKAQTYSRRKGTLFFFPFSCAIVINQGDEFAQEGKERKGGGGGEKEKRETCVCPLSLPSLSLFRALCPRFIPHFNPEFSNICQFLIFFQT